MYEAEDMYKNLPTYPELRKIGVDADIVVEELQAQGMPPSDARKLLAKMESDLKQRRLEQ